MPIPDETEQKRLRSLLPELNQLPDGWKIKVQSDSKKHISYVKGNREVLDHPQCGPLPKGWCIRLCTNADTRVVEPRYENQKDGKTYLKDPRIRGEVLRAHSNKVQTYHGNDAAIFSIAGNVRKSVKGERLADMQRAPVPTKDISDHYEYLHCIDNGGAGGIGGMNGGVFVVRLRGTNRLYVEKRFKQEVPSDHDIAINEITLLRRAKHGALNFYIAGQIVFGKCAVWLELCDRGSLSDIIEAYEKERRACGESEVKPHMPEKWLWHCLIGLCDALAFLQTGLNFISDNIQDHEAKDPNWIPIIHRDIKPDNILLKSREQSGHRKYFYCVISDFGLAVEDVPKGHPSYNKGHATGRLCGTGYWLAPELCWSPWASKDEELFPDRRHHTAASDLWAVGTIIYCMADCDRFGQIDWKAAQNEPPGTDSRFSRKAQNLDRAIKGYYSKPLFKSVLEAAAPEKKYRPTAAELVIKMCRRTQQLYGNDTSPGPDEMLPEWSFRKHEYHSAPVQTAEELVRTSLAKAAQKAAEKAAKKK